MCRRNLPQYVGVLLLACAAGPAVAGIAEHYIFHLEGSQEVPPGPSPASGGCMATLDGTTLSLTCTHNVDSATLMHIHRGSAGVNGLPAFDMGDPAVVPVVASWTGMSTSDIEELRTGDLYMNIHSAGRPDGEIRGQILLRTVAGFDFSMDGNQQVPPAVTSAIGRCIADLNFAATMLSVTCTHDVAMATTAHIHRAPGGENGPVVFAFPGVASPFSGTTTMDAEDVAELAAGFLYVNVHSLDFPDDENPQGDPGEIRGQIVDTPIFTDGFESGDTAAW